MRYTMLPVFLIGVTLSGQMPMQDAGEQTTDQLLTSDSRTKVEVMSAPLVTGLNISDTSRQAYSYALR